MIIETTDKEIIIRLPLSVDTDGIQSLIEYLIYKKATAESKADQKDVDILATEVKSGRWKRNKKAILKNK